MVFEDHDPSSVILGTVPYLMTATALLKLQGHTSLASGGTCGTRRVREPKRPHDVRRLVSLQAEGAATATLSEGARCESAAGA